MAPSLARRAADVTDRLREALKRWFDFYDGYRPDFAWWLKKPCEEAGEELKTYAKLLRQDMAGCKGKDDDPLLGDPIGATALAEDLRAEWIPYTADELIALAGRELSWCEGQMKIASREMKLGDDWHAALGRVKADYAPPGQQGELVAHIAREATAFVKQRNLLAVPSLCEESWRLAMVPPEDVKTLPYAAYDGERILVAYSNREMDQDRKAMVMRGNNRHFLRLVIPHELIPGHHLQGFYAARYRTPYPFTPFYVEGWAFYWEMRLWDAGWSRTPEDRIGMLFWRMHRCARVMVTLKYHLGQITPAEMVDFLIDRVGHERLGATSEVRRYLTAPSLYQCSYLLGGLQLRALRKELVEGGTMSDPEFHLAVLQRANLPIELLRAAMVGPPLARSSRPAWRFAEELRAERP